MKRITCLHAVDNYCIFGIQRSQIIKSINACKENNNVWNNTKNTESTLLDSCTVIFYNTNKIKTLLYRIGSKILFFTLIGFRVCFRPNVEKWRFGQRFSLSLERRITSVVSIEISHVLCSTSTSELGSIKITVNDLAEFVIKFYKKKNL